MNTIDGFRVERKDLQFLGTGLSRPECIIAQPDGVLRVSDDRGMYTLHQDGKASVLVGRKRGVTNGMALGRDGWLYIADIEAQDVYRIGLNPNPGREEIVFNGLNHTKPGAVNFVYFDMRGRLWITISTRWSSRPDAIAQGADDGYVLLMDEHGGRVAAEGIQFTNEVRVDAAGQFLYVAETAAGHVSRFRLERDGTLSERQIYGPSPIFDGAKIDGITFDVQGNLWVTEITQNAIVVIKPDGSSQRILHDPNGEFLPIPTSVTFGGKDLKTVYVGSLKTDSVAWFRSPVAGLPLYHWT